MIYRGWKGMSHLERSLGIAGVAPSSARRIFQFPFFESFRFPVVTRAVSICLMLFFERTAFSQVSTLDVLFPAGGQAGQWVDVSVSGSHPKGLRTLFCNAPGIRCEAIEPGRFRLAIPPGTPPGQYDVWAVSEHGVSAPRTFSISHRTETIEAEPNDETSTATLVPLDVVINGRLDKAGDADLFRFVARRGQRVILECSAERIDSRMRAVLELFDATGRRLAVNRGYFGIDPLIDFRVPQDGEYLVKVQDLLSGGSAEHYYRLEIDTGPRVALTVPNVVQRGKATKVTLFGWNLSPVSQADNQPAALDRIEVEIPESLAQSSFPLPVRLAPSQVVFEGFAYHLPGSHAVVAIGVTDQNVVLERLDNHSESTAQEIAAPCEVSGRLVAGDECDWYAFHAHRGEVFHLEAFGQRIQSPVDLQFEILHSTTDSLAADRRTAPRELARFGDEVRNIGGKFPTNHLDPAGRWVCPADGRYLIAIRNLIGGLHENPRRSYRLSLRREEPDVHLVAIPAHSESAGLNLPRGGREALEVLAFRQRGFEGMIRISAKDLPEGVECPDVWLGPGVERTNVVVSAAPMLKYVLVN
jgi:hypothetical protein